MNFPLTVLVEQLWGGGGNSEVKNKCGCMLLPKFCNQFFLEFKCAGLKALACTGLKTLIESEVVFKIVVR